MQLLMRLYRGNKDSPWDQAKKHRAATRRGELEKSAIAQHAWNHHHQVDWNEVVVLAEAANNTTLLIKALYIHLTDTESWWTQTKASRYPTARWRFWARPWHQQVQHQAPHDNDIVHSWSNAEAETETKQVGAKAEAKQNFMIKGQKLNSSILYLLISFLVLAFKRLCVHYKYCCALMKTTTL